MDRQTIGAELGVPELAAEVLRTPETSYAGAVIQVLAELGIVDVSVSDVLIHHDRVHVEVVGLEGGVHVAHPGKGEDEDDHRRDDPDGRHGNDQFAPEEPIPFTLTLDDPDEDMTGLTPDLAAMEAALNGI